MRRGKAQIGIIYADGELKVDMDFFLLGQARFLTVSSALTAQPDAGRARFRLKTLPPMRAIAVQATRTVVHLRY